MTCYCGHDCARCFVYLGMTAEAQAFYRERFGIDVPAEKLVCQGGRTETVCYLCEGCPFRACCREKGIESCADCTEPCRTWREYKEKYVNRCGQL